jgi:hypothetical protein
MRVREGALRRWDEGQQEMEEEDAAFKSKDKDNQGEGGRRVDRRGTRGEGRGNLIFKSKVRSVQPREGGTRVDRRGMRGEGRGNLTFKSKKVNYSRDKGRRRVHKRGTRGRRKGNFASKTREGRTRIDQRGPRGEGRGKSQLQVQSKDKLNQREPKGGRTREGRGKEKSGQERDEGRKRKVSPSSPRTRSTIRLNRFQASLECPTRKYLAR